MSYLVLHIDLEFIVGAVCADDGTSYPITNGKEDLLWLYFHNNPHQNSISFGKDNKAHFNDLEVNYYGKFFEKIEKEIETFTLRGIEHPVVDLLKEAGLFETIRKAYQQKTLDNTDKIPTLLTFSSSISDNAKQKTVDYLTKNGFQIDSYTIPIAELTCYHALNQKSLKIVNGSAVIFMEASNSTLHLFKLSLADNYFLKDSKTISYKGKGLDPRKRALVRFVVNEVNKTTGVLSSEDEKEDEIDRMESVADEWLKKLDAKGSNTPLNIPSVSFAKTPNMTRQVLVRKDDLDSDTGQYTQDLKDIFDAFRNDNVKGDVAAVFLLGNCFQSDRVKNSFEQMTGRERLHFYANKDIRDILTMYPKIDINRYANEETRIKERAKAEELKNAEQRAFEDKQRKEQEAEDKRLSAEREAEDNRKKAQKIFETAIKLDKAGKLEDARVNAENALSLDKTNREYKQFLADLTEKIDKLNAKNELYKSYLSKADKLLANGDLVKALDEYEAAKFVFDNAEIIQKIIEVKRQIKNIKQQEERLSHLLSEVQSLINQNKFIEAKAKVNEILLIDKENSAAKAKLTEIDIRLKDIEIQYGALVKEADKNLNNQIFDAAIRIYKEALKAKPNDTYCLEQLSNIQTTIQQRKADENDGLALIAAADDLFKEEKWQEAKEKYEKAAKLIPTGNGLSDKIQFCSDKLRECEDKIKDLLFEAKDAYGKAKKSNKIEDYDAALSFLYEALTLNPGNNDILTRIEKYKDDKSKLQSQSDKKDDGFFNSKKLNIKDEIVETVKQIDEKTGKNKEDDFIKKSKSQPKKEEKEDDFIIKKKVN